MDEVKMLALLVVRLADGSLLLRDAETKAEIYRGPEGRAMRDAVWTHFNPGVESEEVEKVRRGWLH